jgi:hypothetical protein
MGLSSGIFRVGTSKIFVDPSDTAGRLLLSLLLDPGFIYHIGSGYQVKYQYCSQCMAEYMLPVEIVETITACIYCN